MIKFSMPMIDRAQLPKDEVTAAHDITSNLMQLMSAAREFRHTAMLYLELYPQFNEQRDPDRLGMLGSWVNMTGRNGAIVAHGFYLTMQAINAAKAPYIWSKVDMAERDKATAMFVQEFPNSGPARHSAAHPGELSSGTEKLAENSTSNPIITEQISLEGISFLQHASEMYSDRQIYQGTRKGKLQTSEISLAKADVLDTIYAHYCATFEPLEIQRFREMKLWRAETEAQRDRD